MVKKIGGFRRKTRYKLARPRRERGKLSITRIFQKFEAGDKVILEANSFSQRGMYHPREHGKVAVVKEKAGRSYKLSLKEGKKEKNPIVHPMHLRKIKV